MGSQETHPDTETTQLKLKNWANYTKYWQKQTYRELLSIHTELGGNREENKPNRS